MIGGGEGVSVFAIVVHLHDNLASQNQRGDWIPVFLELVAPMIFILLNFVIIPGNGNSKL